MNRQLWKQTHFDVAAYQVFTSQNYPYLQMQYGLHGTEIAALNFALFAETLR